MSKRKQKVHAPGKYYITGGCSCRGAGGRLKKGHTTKDSAKAQARLIRAQGGHVRPYRCPERPDLWHVGRLARPVLNGERTAAEHYGNGVPA